MSCAGASGSLPRAGEQGRNIYIQLSSKFIYEPKADSVNLSADFKRRYDIH